ncbi:MAG: nucleoside triphosphate pyrophosphohydrolase family protein [Cyanobacteria bacterium P01_E01_bin.6]
MQLNEYATESQKFANHDLDFKTAIATWGLGITGESGEVADIIKKYIGHGHSLDRTSLIKELGDVLWYVAAIAFIESAMEVLHEFP